MTFRQERHRQEDRHGGGGGGKPNAAEVDLYSSDGGYFLSARLNVSLPGVDPIVAQSLVEAADQICPYSKVIRGNIEVAINLV